MVGLLIVTAFALFANDNSEFFKDVEVKREQGCTFTYVGKQYARQHVPHIAWGEHVYFSMEPCKENDDA